MAESAPRRARDRVRAELTSEIAATARAHLAEHGASGLSLRAVSRDLGMASSALYRYFPSRDALLTALIIDAYNALGEACERAEGAIDRDDLLGRWRAIAHAVRDWALAHPHEYALIYGSPVPGYAAPDDTVGPASRTTMLLFRLVADIDAAGTDVPLHSPVSSALADQLAAILALADLDVSHPRLLGGIAAWTNLFGMISFELFGQYQTIFDDADELFAHQVDLAAAAVGLPPD